MDKENSTKQKLPLTMNNNHITPQKTKEQHKTHKQDQLLIAVQEEIGNNRGCNLFSVILSDPLLKELNSSLEKQAEQQKKTKLLQSFPLRYKNLIHTEILYKKTQIQLKEHQKQSNEVIELLQKEKEVLVDQLSFFKAQLQRKDDGIVTLSQKHNNELNLNQQQLNTQLQQKDQQLKVKDLQFAQLQRKIVKIQCEKTNLIEFIEQTKEQSENLKKENERIILIITQKDSEINNLNKIINQKQKNYQSSKQHFMAQMVSTQLECSQKIKQITKQCNQLSNLNQGLKIRLNQCQDQIAQMLTQKQQLQNNHFTQMQDLRGQLLQSIKNKNCLQQQIDQLQSHLITADELKSQIIELEIEIDSKEIYIKQIVQQREIEFNRIKEAFAMMELIKNQSIQHMEGKMTVLNQEKIQTQEKLVRIEVQKEELIKDSNLLKSQLDQQCKNLNDFNEMLKKKQTNGKQIEKMIKQLKIQLDRIAQTIQQKDQKMMQYRKEILSLRHQLKDVSIEKEEKYIEISKIMSNHSSTIKEKQDLQKQIEKYQQKECALNTQLNYYDKLQAVQKMDSQTQVQIIQGFNDQELIQNQKVLKQLEKTKMKYENVIQQLQEYKKQLFMQKQQTQTLIQQLQTDNFILQNNISSKLQESNEIEQIFDTKINEMKTFYQQKIQQEHKKYRTVIGLLKSEVAQLCRQMSLKKSIEQEIYQDLAKINYCHLTNFNLL